MTLRGMIGDPSRKDLRLFAGLQFAFFGILCLFVFRDRFPTGILIGLMGVSFGVALVGLIWPLAIRPIYVAWMVAVFPIGWTISHLCMAIVYYAVVTPIGLYRRLTTGDPLQRQFEREKTTYWIRREIPRKSTRYFRQF